MWRQQHSGTKFNRLMCAISYQIHTYLLCMIIATFLLPLANFLQFGNSTPSVFLKNIESLSVRVKVSGCILVRNIQSQTL